MPLLKNEFDFLNSTIKRNLRIKDDFAFALGCPTVCVSGLWAGRDSLREQEKLEARKILENRAESHKSTARFVRCVFILQTRSIFAKSTLLALQ
jgi:hypothetical protein